MVFIGGLILPRGEKEPFLSHNLKRCLKLAKLEVEKDDLDKKQTKQLLN